VRGAVESVVLDLITGGRSSPDIKRALLSHAPALAGFFGRRDINDVLLPLLITCLNAGSWQLRGAFFAAVAGIGAYGGRDSLDVFLLPCLEQVGATGRGARRAARGARGGLGLGASGGPWRARGRLRGAPRRFPSPARSPSLPPLAPRTSHLAQPAANHRALPPPLLPSRPPHKPRRSSTRRRRSSQPR
jgi:hypothetical protein